MKALWAGEVIAESNETVVVDGNHYFPPSSLKGEFFSDSDTHTTCGWKGVASYKNIVVAGDTNKDAAWFYPDPLKKAENIRDHYAFWRGVTVVE